MKSLDRSAPVHVCQWLVSFFSHFPSTLYPPPLCSVPLCYPLLFSHFSLAYIGRPVVLVLFPSSDAVVVSLLCVFCAIIITASFLE